MSDKAELSLLLDYYGAFLTERQRELMAMSADLDMSLSEIADEVGISRQAVRDALSRSARELAEYETKLGLAERDRRIRAVASSLEEAVSSGETEQLKKAASAAAEELAALIR